MTASRSATPKRRRRLPAGERRPLILEAAGRLFGEHGYDHVRLDQIAAAAGVTKPILYRHFDSKQALYLALLERHRDDIGRFAGVVPPGGRIEERISTLLDAWLDYVAAHSYAWRMLFRDTGGGAEIAGFRRAVHARARSVLAGIIETLGEGRIPRRETEPLAELLSMGMASLVLWWIESADVSRDAVRSAIARVWMGLLARG